MIITSIIIIITIIIIIIARACTCASRVNIYSFYGIFNYVQKKSTLSFSTTVFIFSTFGLDPWRQYRTGISIVHILVRSMCLVTTAFLFV